MTARRKLLGGGWRAGAALALAFCAAASPSSAEPPRNAEPVPPVVLRTGTHPGYGRIVVDIPPGVTAEAVRAGDQVEIRLTTEAVPSPAGRVPRNVRDLSVGPGLATLTLAPGAGLRQMRLGQRLVLDALDPTPAPAASAPATPADPRRRRAAPQPASATAARSETSAPLAAPPVLARPAAESVAAPEMAEPPRAPSVSALAAAVPAPVDAVPLSSPGPVALAAAVKASGFTAAALTLPFGRETGAAAFRRGASAVVVFDERRPVDLSPLRGVAPFSDTFVQLLPGATILRLTVAETAGLRLRRVPEGWEVALLASDPLRAEAPDAIRIDAEEDGLHFRAAGPGRVIALPDPMTGGTLLVGTQRGPGQPQLVGRTAPGLIVLPTWQGVAIEPVTDALVLREATEGFVATARGGGGRLAIAPADGDAAVATAAARFSRRYAFDAVGADGLTRRLQAAIVAAGAAPAQSRGSRRVDVARALIAQGRGAEARAVLAVAVSDDPRLADDPDAIGLGAIAAILAGRPDDAAGLDDPSLTGTDDIALWRAIRQVMQTDQASEAAPVLAATIPLLRSYPAPLRERLLPIATETLLLAGARRVAAETLAAEPEAPALAFARALALEAEPGEAARDAAVAAFTRLAQDSDRLVRLRAGARAIELRLAAGQITAGRAAREMGRLIVAWRGDGRELSTRLRTAALHEQAGQWRDALALLRETEPLWPDRKDQVRAQLRAVFGAALQADEAHALPPLELVTLAEENADLVGGDEGGDALAARLADRLSALDLPARSARVLETLLAGPARGAPRAAIGAALARARLLNGDAAAAVAALEASRADDVPQSLETERAMIEARALAAKGDPTGASERLARLAAPEADELRAKLAEGRRDWASAEAALRSYVAKVVPDSGALAEPQAQMVLRLASAAAQAGDEAGLAELRLRHADRLPPGAAASMFALLTQSPVRGASDLARVSRETAAARAMAEPGQADTGRRPVASR